MDPPDREPRLLWPTPDRLTSAAPAGARADRTLGLKHNIVRMSLEVDEDPFGLGSPRFADGWALEDLITRFAIWMRRRPFALGTATAMREVADAFAGYLDENLLTLYACTEYDLRLYLYDWLPRNGGRRQTRPSAVIEGLSRFFEYLEAEEGLSYPWGAALLGDEPALAARCSDPPQGRVDDPAVIAWRRELYEDVDARVFLPDPGIAGGGEWLRAGVVPLDGGDEDEEVLELLFETYDELCRRWLVWREEVIGAGVTDPDRARAVLVRRQREWETRGHPGLWNESPSEAIRKERGHWRL